MSSISFSYKEKSDPYADGYAFVKYKDTNPSSSSYNNTEWRRASNRDSECKGQVKPRPCELSVNPGSVSFTINPEASSMNQDTSRRVNYSLSGNCGGDIVNYEFNASRGVPAEIFSAISVQKTNAHEESGTIVLRISSIAKGAILKAYIDYHMSDSIHVGDLIIGGLSTVSSIKNVTVPVYISVVGV